MPSTPGKAPPHTLVPIQRAQLAELREGKELRVMDVVDLEDEVRQGRLTRGVLLHFPPWTGEAWLPIAEIPALAEAAEAPAARLTRHFEEPPLPLFTALLASLVLLGVTAQGLFQSVAFDSEKLSALYDSALGRLMVGAAPLFLDGHWWSPWSAPFMHAGPFHALGNLAILLYCGFRVERALGSASAAIVTASAVLVSTLFIALGSDLPVIGSSTIAYGLWGAQITLGFRLAEQIPRKKRAFYGWGNFVLFAPLFAFGFTNPIASHFGHLGGLLGGVLAACLLRPETMAPSASRSTRSRRNFIIAGLIGITPMLLAPLGAVAPRFFLGGLKQEMVEELGLGLSLPSRMSGRDLRFLGMRAWILDPNDDEPVFAGLWFRNDLETSIEEASLDRWREHLGGEPIKVEAPAPISPEWSVSAFRLDSRQGTPWRVVEHTLTRGRYVLRVGYGLREGRGGRGRERLYDTIVRTAIATDPPSLVEAREKYEALPRSTQRKMEYVEKLGLLGKVEEAELLLDSVRDPDWTWNVADDRLWLAIEFPEKSSRDAVAFASEMLLSAPAGAPTILLRSLTHLATEKACEPVLDFRERRLAEVQNVWINRPSIAEEITLAVERCRSLAPAVSPSTPSTQVAAPQ